MPTEMNMNKQLNKLVLVEINNVKLNLNLEILIMIQQNITADKNPITLNQYQILEEEEEKEV